MNRYELAGFVIETSMNLPELLRSSRTRADCVVEVCPLDAALVVRDGDDWLHVERGPTSTSLRFADLAVFEVDPTYDRVVCRAAPGVPDETLRHLLLDHVLPRLLGERGFLVLHASAVVSSFGALGFCGQTGAGKSTLATSFALAGAALLADDALVLTDTAGGLRAHPTYPSVRLWREHAHTVVAGAPLGERVAHYTEKRRFGKSDLATAAFATSPCPVAALFLLAAGPDVAVTPMTSRDAFIALSGSAFRLDPNDRSAFEANFDRLARSPLLRACYTLRYPHDHARLPDVRAAVLATVSEAA